MGCGNPDLCIEVITTGQLIWGDVVSIKKLLIYLSGGLRIY